MSEERNERIREWLRDDITIEFFSIVQIECRAARNDAVATAARGENATKAAATCEAHRWTMTSAIEVLKDEKETREVVRNGQDEKDPEECDASGFADALQEGDGGAGIDDPARP